MRTPIARVGPAAWLWASWLWACGVLAALVVASPAPRAQELPSVCTEAVADADSLYRGGQFAEVELSLNACLNGTAEGPVEAYRLLALSLVRQRRLAEAQEVVLELLAAHPDYTPDRIQDPPVYVALVTLVGRQVTGDRPAEAALPPSTVVEPIVPTTPALDGPAPAPLPPPVVVLPLPLPVPPAGFRQPGAVVAEGSLGMESYDGERRRVGDGIAGGFFTNGGLSGGVAVGLQTSHRFSVDLRVHSLTLPGLIRDGIPDSESGYLTDGAGVLGFPVTEYPTIDPATSSHRVSSVAVALRADARPGHTVSPYVRAGGQFVLRRVNGATRVGYGPLGALGVEVAPGSRVAFFGETSASLIVPDDALDAAVYRTNGDLLLGARAGLRFRLATLR